MAAEVPVGQGLPPSQSVREFIERIRKLLREAGGGLVLRGVVSGCRGSGFFDLVDEQDARLSISCSYYGNDQVLAPLVDAGFPIQDGLPVMLKGYATLSNARSQVRMVITDVVPQYTRAVLKSKRDETNERLTREGAFAAQSSVRFPLLPRTLGLITSDRGVVFADVAKALSAARFEFRYVWIRCAVQGADAVRDIPRAIAELGAHPQVDVICIFRGGGSALELDAFNSYEIARAICDCPKPVLSAIGHKTDECSAQDVAFRNCHTPSLLGEFLVGRVSGLRQRVEAWTGAIAKRVRQEHTEKAKDVRNVVGLCREHIGALVSRHRSEVRLRAATVPQLARRLRDARCSQLRLTTNGMPSALRHVRRHHTAEVQQLGKAIMFRARGRVSGIRKDAIELCSRVPSRGRTLLARTRRNLADSRRWLIAAVAFVRSVRSRVEVMTAQMKANDPEEQLRRGFAILRDGHGRILTSVDAIDREEEMELQMRDGRRKISRV